jgi:hypothetical protein
MLPHKRWRWIWCSRPQGRWRYWSNNSGVTRAASPRTCTCTVITMTPGIPDPAKIMEVHYFGQGSRNSTTQWHAVVVIPLVLCSPLGGHAGERERWRAAARGGWRQGGGGGRLGEEGLVELVCSPPLPRLPLYKWWGGCTLPPPKPPRAATKGGDRGGG